jgi:tetratricopeptide (TPR) repeat protein
MAAGGAAGNDWDFFISYTKADQPWAEWIAWILEEDDHRVLIQAWDFVPGRNWIRDMQAGAEESIRTIAVLSPGYLRSVYASAEWQAAWADDPDGRGRKLLVARVADCARPGLLHGVVGVDLFGLTDATAAARLREMVTSALAGRAKPKVRPPYPGVPRAIPDEPRFPGTAERAQPGNPDVLRSAGEQPVWNVPDRNPNFTGRGTELGQITRSLAAASRVVVHSVHGMGGVGKSQLAIEYAHSHAADYDVVWWIAAEETASIPDQYTGLAGRLGLDPVADPDALRAQVHDRLRRVPRWLLIFDNAAAAGDIQPWLPAGPLPAGVAGHVMATTRRGGFGALGRVLDLDVIPLPDALRLMRKRVPRLDQAAGKQIAEELGRLPLALDQAAAYLDLSQLSGREYLELLRTRAGDLYQRGRVASRDDTMATLWDLSLGRLRTETPAAVQLLAVCAYLAPEPIPLDLFTSHPSALPEPLAAAAADPVGFTDTVTVVVDYSLAKRTPAGLQLHRLVQAAVRSQHEPSHDVAARNGLTARHPLPTAIAILRADAPEQITSVPQAWPRWAVLLPHVLAATGHLDDAPAPSGRTLLTNAAWLLDGAGTYLHVHARLTDARGLLERALAIDENLYGPDHPDVGTDLNNLAQILQDLGQPSQAQPLQERALAIAEAAYHPDHPGVAIRLNNLAQILQDLGQPARARPLQERALAIDEATYGPDHPDVARDLNNLAAILRALGQPDRAQPLQERALAIDEATYRPDHPEVATDLNNLAAILRALGQPDRAQPLQERALAIDEAAYGPDHPVVARDLNNLAQILRDLGQSAQAQHLQERALAITEATYGPGHPAIARDLNNLATILLDLGQPGPALPFQQRALAITEAAYGPSHPAVAIRLNNLAQILRDLGQPAQAQPWQERALAITEACYGPGHPAVATALNNLAQILADRGETEQARPLWERARTIRSRDSQRG